MVRKSHNVSASMTHNGPKEEIIFEITDANTVVAKRKHEVISAADLAAATPVKIIRTDVIAAPHPQTQTPAAPTSLPKHEPVGTPATTPANTSVEQVEPISVESDRARSLGNFVAAQINGIKDDYLFYSTQMDVLNVINKALLKQLHMDKEEKAGRKASAVE